MPVLVEALSVICRLDSIHKKLRGGWGAFEAMVPNKTLCADNEIARVGFMSPPDVEAFIGRLIEGGLEWFRDGKCIDIATADQVQGVLNACPWLEFGRVAIDGTGEQRVGACRMAGGRSSSLFFPEGWQYERSLSQSGQFVPNGRVESAMRFLRREGSLDVYLDRATGKEVYLATGS